MEQLYAALPLNRHEEEIRLLHVHLGTWDAEIEGKFSVVSLKKNPEFIALSYTWGDMIDAPPAAVKVRGQAIPVSPNLHDALRRLRWHTHQASHYKRLVIWADALCINQADMQEKQHQIPLMRKIYSQCQYTALWLGEISYDNLTTNPGAPEPVEAARKIIVELHNEEHLTSIKPFDRDGTDAHFINVQNVFNTLAESPWFTRRWVIQEAVLSPAVEVFFGPLSMELSFLSRAMDMYSEHIEKSCCTTSEHGHYMLRRSIRTFLQEFTSLRYYRYRHGLGSKTHILELCREFTSRETSLDADYVYSLLGLTNPTSSIVPDYSIPLHVLFTDICKDYMIESRSLNLLPFAGISDRQSEMPSWAIDWTKAETSWRLRTGLFSCIGRLTQTPRIRDENHLRIAGYHVDEIEGIAEFPIGSSTASTVKAFGLHITENELFEAEYPTGGTWIEAWLRTLSADCCWGANSARRLTTEDLDFYLDALSGMPIETGQRVQLAGGRKVLADAHLNDIFRMVYLVQDGRVLFYTRKGYIGVADNVVEIGDVIYLVRSSYSHGDAILLRHGRCMDT